ncbi:MAG: hypothetical protein HRU41_29945 [Saprospiraceae bacterium]|nr:hypothetical protein [Saprospiraceae bacterium]
MVIFWFPTAAIVMDNLVVIAGTFNFSQAANFNEEVIVILGNLETEDQNAILLQAELGTFIRAEIDRLILEAYPLPYS